MNWTGPTDEEGYLDAISHTKYWVASGLKAAIVFAGRQDLHPFVNEFSEYYGTTCQLYDDVREVKDDVENGYWSLPISLAHQQGLDLENPNELALATNRSLQLGRSFTDRAMDLCGDSFPNLKTLVTNMRDIIPFYQEMLQASQSSSTSRLTHP